MKCDDFEVMLAEALGGELSEAGRPAFERHLAECAACSRDYETALATVARLRNLPAPGAEHVIPVASAEHALVDSARMAEVTPQVIPMSRRRWGLSALRYAASIVIAFAAGYAANGFRGNEQAADSPLRPPVVGSIENVQLADASFGAAFAETYQRRPNSSELSRCLTAMFGKQN